MQVVPLQPVPSQSLQVALNGQACTLAIFQYAYGLFITLSIGTTVIVASVPCQNLRTIVRNDYFGFVGDLVFVDTQRSDDPVYTGLGSRWQLVYLLPSELPANVAR